MPTLSDTIYCLQAVSVTYVYKDEFLGIHFREIIAYVHKLCFLPVEFAKDTLVCRVF